MANIDNIFEDFDLNGLSSHDGIGFDFPLLDESNVELHDIHVEVDEKTNLDRFLFVSFTFYSFKCEVREYLIKCLKHPAEVEANPNMIRTLDANLLCCEEGTLLELFHQSILKK
jgi:hypothetical protein